jgi:hypothetical protein
MLNGTKRAGLKINGGGDAYVQNHYAEDNGDCGFEQLIPHPLTRDADYVTREVCESTKAGPLVTPLVMVRRTRYRNNSNHKVLGS